LVQHLLGAGADQIFQISFIGKSPEHMSSRLDRIEDWEALARDSRFRINEMASRCGVSARQLERYFMSRFGERPYSLLNRVRLKDVKRLLSGGESVKAAAFEVGYKQSSNLSREFKKAFGVRPTSFTASSFKQKKKNVAFGHQMSGLDK
jgi:AraC-like DNA-binding protein